MANDAAADGKATPDAAPAAATAAADGKTPAADTAAPKGSTGVETPKPAAGAPAATAGGKDGTAQPEPKVPDSYELTVPKGAESYIEADDVAEITAIAKERGWTAEQAQQALDDHADAIAARSAAFRAEVEKDPVYGGKNLEQSQIQATRALDRMWPQGTPEREALGKLLTKTGFGNHRLIVGGLANLGKLMQEDNPQGQRAPSGAKVSPEEKLYGAKG
jgi:hypothetical protein